MIEAILYSLLGGGLLAMAADEGIRRDPVLAGLVLLASIFMFWSARRAREERRNARSR